MVRDVRERELRLSTDAGRICRPLFIVTPEQTLALNKDHVNQIYEEEASWDILFVLKWPPCTGTRTISDLRYDKQSIQLNIWNGIDQ